MKKILSLLFLSSLLSIAVAQNGLSVSIGFGFDQNFPSFTAGTSHVNANFLFPRTIIKVSVSGSYQTQAERFFNDGKEKWDIRAKKTFIPGASAALDLVAAFDKDADYLGIYGIRPTCEIGAFYGYSHQAPAPFVKIGAEFRPIKWKNVTWWIAGYPPLSKNMPLSGTVGGGLAYYFRSIEAE